jgi:DNA-binding MarR family transcriptional regulator
MFFLKDLPTEKTLKNLRKRYPDLDLPALMSCIALMRTGSDMMAALERILGRYRLSQGRFLTLIVLNRDPEEEVTPSDLAERVGVTRATMTGLLDTLAKDGWIERIRHNEDRRRVVVRLTQEGLDHLGRMLPGYYRGISSIMAGLEGQEHESLVRVLGKVREGLSGYAKKEKGSGVRRAVLPRGNGRRKQVRGQGSGPGRLKR